VRGGHGYHLQVASDMYQEGDIADTSNNEQKKRTGADSDGEEGSDSEGGRRQTVSPEVLCDVVPGTRILMLDEPNGVQGEGVDGLTWSIGQQQALPALKGSKNIKQETNFKTAYS
jgi:hypothetical protein